jgi:hypothetical protein
MSGKQNELVHAVLAGLNESQSKGGLIIRKKKTDGTTAGFQVPINKGSGLRVVP